MRFTTNFVLRPLALGLVITSSVATATLPQDAPSLDAEIPAIDGQITEVEETISRYEGGLIRALAQSRREALLLLRTVVESRKQAEAGGAVICAPWLNFSHAEIACRGTGKLLINARTFIRAGHTYFCRDC